MEIVNIHRAKTKRPRMICRIAGYHWEAKMFDEMKLILDSGMVKFKKGQLITYLHIEQFDDLEQIDYGKPNQPKKDIKPAPKEEIKDLKEKTFEKRECKQCGTPLPEGAHHATKFCEKCR